MVHGSLNSNSGLGHCQSRLLSLGGNLVGKFIFLFVFEIHTKNFIIFFYKKGEYYPLQETDEEVILKISKTPQVFLFTKLFNIHNKIIIFHFLLGSFNNSSSIF